MKNVFGRCSLLVGRKGRGWAGAKTGDRLAPGYVCSRSAKPTGRPRTKETITVEQLSSLPMQHAGGHVRPEDYLGKSTQHVDCRNSISSRRIFLPRFAVIWQVIMSPGNIIHLNIRFLSFLVIDALCGEAAETNYINFRFKGVAPRLRSSYRLLYRSCSRSFALG